MICRECGLKKGHYEDPRDPPIDEGYSLCGECYDAAIEEKLLDLQDELTGLEVIQERRTALKLSKLRKTTQIKKSLSNDL